MNNEDKINVRLSPSKSFITISEGNQSVIFLDKDEVKELIEKLTKLSHELHDTDCVYI